MNCIYCGVEIHKKLYGSYNRCQSCHREIGRRRRLADPEANNAYHRARRVKDKENILLAYFEKADYIAKAKDTPCVDCGGSFPAWVMQFDHVRGEKSRILSHMKTYSLKRIQEEIDKCEPVCANCHADRTERRRVQRVLKSIK